ncbi:MAG: hypothetical protein ABI681_00220 [Gemmatimonadales bacterium]
MNTLRDSRSPEPDRSPRRPSRALVLSVALHLVLAFALVRYLVSPAAFMMIFGRAHSPEVPAERIGFLRLPKSSGPPVAGRSGGDGRPVSKTPPKRLVAPTAIPTTIAPAPPSAPQSAEPEQGSGPLVGTGGPARGIRPSYSDPRVWVAPGDIVAAPKSAKEKLDSAIASIVAPFNDSVAIASGQRKPGDWTFERGGRKYGIDPQFIRLGKVSIPTALLALLPINTTGNPTMNDRNRAQNQLHSDIFWQAQRGMNEADFKKAVKSIRERKEREKAAAEKQTRQAEKPAASPPERQ